MAENIKKAPPHGGKHTSKKRGSSGKKGNGKNSHKEKSRLDILTIVVIVLAVILVVFLLVNYNKQKNKEQEPGGLSGTPTSAPSATVTKTPDGNKPTGTPVVQPTGAPTGTPSATQKPEDERPTPAPTEAPMISREEAERIVRNRIELPDYTIELLDDHLMIDGEEYYSFCINDENGTALEPLLIVEKKEGELFCYDFAGVVSPFSKFPLDKTETGSSGTDVISEEEAKKVLSGYSKEALGLSEEVSAYEMEVDSWKTVADGKECYGIDLIAVVAGKRSFCGTFYVALDGSAVYSRDDATGEFIKR